MRVIGTVGLPGSGKGEVATVALELGLPVVTMGDIIREECRRRGLDPAEDHGRVARALREEEGRAAIAERSLPHIRERLEGSDTVLVDGLRSDVELDTFVEAFGDDFQLVSVEAPFETRAERLLDRGRDESDLDREALEAREERELGFGMGEAMARADVRITNTDTLESFRERVERVLRGEVRGVENGEEVRGVVIYSVDVEVHAPVHATEVTDRVRDAVLNLFPDVELTHRNGELIGETHSLDELSKRLHDQAILDTARGEFFADLEDDTFTFRLKKQAAFAGRVNFAVGSESELGDLFVEVTVREPDAETYIDHVAPRTEDGVPVDASSGGEQSR